MCTKIRFNPNLYINGKVCLSLINTWNGPKWTSCNTLSSVLLSIQGLVFNEFPLVNEPGFETIKEIHHIYNNVIEYGNIYVHIYQLVKQISNNNCNTHIQLFKDIITKNFIKTYNSVYDKLKILHKKNKYVDEFICSTYGINVKNNTTEILDNIELIYDALSDNI